MLLFINNIKHLFNPLNINPNTPSPTSLFSTKNNILHCLIAPLPPCCQSAFAPLSPFGSYHTLPQKVSQRLPEYPLHNTTLGRIVFLNQVLLSSINIL